MTLSINFIITVSFMFIALVLGTLIINGLIDQDAYSYRYRQLALFLFGTPPIICFFCVTISLNHIKAVPFSKLIDSQIFVSQKDFFC